MIIGLVLVILLSCAALFAASRTAYLNMFEINPNPATYFANIRLQFSEDCVASVWIEEDGGAIVKQLYTGIVYKDLRLTWNRISDSGIYAGPGTYYVVVNYGGRYTSTKKTLILR